MDLYPFVVAAHVTSVVFFIGGMLMEARLVLALTHLSSVQQATALEAILRLDRQIVTPAMALTWTFGLTLALWYEWFGSPWLMIKLVVVVALSALHGMQSGRLRRGLWQREVRPVRGASTAIILGMLVIATLAFVKPF